MKFRFFWLGARLQILQVFKSYSSLFLPKEQSISFWCLANKDWEKRESNKVWTPIRCWFWFNRSKPSQKSLHHLEKTHFKSFRFCNLWIFYYKMDAVCMHSQRSWVSFATYLQLQSKYLLILTSSSSWKKSKKTHEI